MFFIKESVLRQETRGGWLGRKQHKRSGWEGAALGYGSNTEDRLGEEKQWQGRRRVWVGRRSNR